MTLLMEKCASRGIKVIILDRPNPIGGLQLEGTVLEQEYATFVGRHPIPMRHGLTMGEMAQLAATYHGSKCDLEVITMHGWKRHMYFEETGLPWVWPSPNVPTVDTTVTYVGTVVLEGTNLSEGRGTTKPLELIAHPRFEPFGQLADFEAMLKREGIQGCVLRPCSFIPTFNPGVACTCSFANSIIVSAKILPGDLLHMNTRKNSCPWTFLMARPKCENGSSVDLCLGN
jgi:uncharacterized protein YbbC (DUF1343 family)